MNGGLRFSQSSLLTSTTFGSASTGADVFDAFAGFLPDDGPPPPVGGSVSFSTTSVKIEMNGAPRLSVFTSSTVNLTAIRSPTLLFQGARNLAVYRPFQRFECSMRFGGSQVMCPGESDLEK